MLKLGRKKLLLRAQNLDCESEEQLIVDQMDLKKEFPALNTNLYPSIEPYSTGFLKVSDLHTIYWEQSGNPNGHCIQSFRKLVPYLQPVVFLHGGPGGGTSPNNRRFFDPGFYRIILLDQRGAGKSKPHACLEENTTWDLVGDIERLREHLEIPEWQVFGGSWGSTLALAYSISHPDKVTGIILRGIFLLRKKEIDWFYEGGAAAIFPDAWEPFRDLIPENERKCFVEAYHKRLNSDDLETQYAAARAWTKWEMMTAHLLPNEENIKRGDADDFSLAFARIENHYFINKGFFSSDSFLLDNVEKIKHIKTTIVQGRYDVCCPMMSAWDLHKAWLEAEFIVVPDAGHSANEPGIAAELVAANEKLKNGFKGVC
ncbi:proline iminopeptidase isoform X2 [Nicotiana tomentosiformis]|uniref:proline iminopeptidase isoform X2 n=2 Tax=Nicotiana tomentosiformis TaxID=4098 RepID=UPI00051B3D57|nr:proline iminopeptidase isoform X2 [Nicotiana tomentosiformis]